MAEEEANQVSKLAKTYYRAMVSGDEAALRAVFDPRASITGHFDGAFLWIGLDDFVTETQGAVGSHGVEECQVLSVRVDGDIATAIVGGRYVGLWFVDHLQMVKRAGLWSITAKSFQVVDDA